MDKLSLIGLIIGIGAILGGQVLEGGHIASLAQPTALIIVFGGTLGAVLLQSPFTVFKRGVGMGAWILFPPPINHQGIIENIVQWSQHSRREGLLALENFANQVRDPFARQGLQLLVDGVDAERLRSILEIAIDTYEEELRQAARIWEAAGGYSPTIGILGAVLGLIHVMENLSDPSKLGAGIAVAFVATIYGVGLANLVYLPVANKLKSNIIRLVRARELLMDGLLGIAVGENPHIIENRLRGYLQQEEKERKGRRARR
ncbi:MAG: flagellar motor protein [Zoogloeaceae bacterium]|jgi:chemotaxis protein MotA|nr:flagellar motor protein [Zoogloeaceae bacterium]